MCNTCCYHKSRSFFSQMPSPQKVQLFHIVFNRPSIARAVLQTPMSLSHQSFSSKSSKHNKSQAIRARDWKILHNVHHLSRVTCQVSQDIFLYIFFGQTGGFSCLRVCYPWGIPHLVLVHVENITTGLSYRNKSLSSPPPLSGLIM